MNRKKMNSGIKALALWGLMLVICLFGIGLVGLGAYSPAAAASAAGAPFMLFGFISMFETRTMLQALEKMFLPKTFLLNTFFSDIETFNTEHVDIDIVKGRPSHRGVD